MREKNDDPLVLWELMLIDISLQPTDLPVRWGAHPRRGGHPALFRSDRLGPRHPGAVLADWHSGVSREDGSRGVWTLPGCFSSMAALPVPAMALLENRQTLGLRHTLPASLSLNV